MLFLFGDIVVVDEDQIGVIVKSWINCIGKSGMGTHYEVYVRNYNQIRLYNENEITRYSVRHTYLDNEELEYHLNGVHGN